MKGYRKATVIIILIVGFALRILPLVGVDTSGVDTNSIVAALQNALDSFGALVSIGLMIWSSKSPAPAKILAPN